MNSLLEQWQKRLLDLKASNRLLNFRDPLNMSIDIIAPDADTFFTKLTDGTRLEVFMPLAESEVMEIQASQGRRLDVFLPRRQGAVIPKEQALLFVERLKKNQVLPFKNNANVNYVLNNMQNKSREAIREKGINILFAAFGFLNWSSETDNKTIFKAPLVLVPIQLSRADFMSPYRINEYEDEVIVNPALKLKLETEFQLKLPEIGEGGLLEFFEFINGLCEKMKWTADCNEVKLCLLTFHKVNMYRDIQENESLIMNSLAVNLLLGMRVGDFNNVAVGTSPKNLFCVTDADSSQMSAIAMASKGGSFVLQGPPGTGKSQTITNIIADLLGNGKKVLFVSEKMAALQVVYNNMKKAGLEDFCLELHSHKINKKDVIAEFNRVLKLPSVTVSDGAAIETEALRAAKDELDSYAAALHKKDLSLNMSPYDALSKLIEYHECSDIGYLIPNLKEITDKYLADTETALQKYAALTKSAGADYRLHAFYGYKSSDGSYEQTQKIKAALINLAAALEQAALAASVFNKENSFSFQDALNAAETGRLFNPDFYALDLESLKNTFGVRYKSFMRFLSPAYNKINKQIKGCLKQGKSISYSQIIKSVDVACGLKKKGFAGLRDGEINRLTEIFAKASSAEKDADYLQTLFDKKIKDFFNAPAADALQAVRRMLDNISELSVFVAFNQHLNILTALKLDGFIIASIENKTEPEALNGAYKKLFYRQWFEYKKSSEPALAHFTRMGHDSALKIFKEKDRLSFKIAKAEIMSRLSSVRNNGNGAANGGQLATLLREGVKRRMIMPVRELFSKAGKLCQELKPCFLMSPLSVATYINSNDLKFDAVIFDEASQVFPEDALGAIYRGESLIVVGDSKQMPPTNFFGISVESGDETADEYDMAGIESILDFAAATMPEIRLKWHYRSRVEELISFSNKNFYNNSLNTFPTVIKAGHNNGVELIYLEDGIYDRTSRTNRAEAMKVADMVFEHFLSSDRSLGVVAFSQSQQELIEYIIEKRRRSEPEWEEFFSQSKQEPFFVKNLETVQGDERDTIIFSIAYAKDSGGKFIHNFGPLNRIGGERRLNVAVTRAKFNVKVVSSIRSSDIDTARSGSEGSRLLKEYLHYAEFGNSKTEKGGNLKNASVAGEIAQFLSQNGFKCETGIGCSDYKIDVAVKNPDTDEYILAIEADGRNYANLEARDRDRLREEVLKRVGWRHYRQWSVSWSCDNAEKERLKREVEAALKSVKENLSAPTNEKEFTQEVSRTESERLFPEYVCADIPALIKNEKFRRFPDLLNEILTAEAPVCENELLRRLEFYYKKESQNYRIRELFNKSVPALPNIQRRNGFIYLKDREIAFRIHDNSQPRDFAHICDEELNDGILKIITANVGINQDSLITEMRKTVKATRITPFMREKLSRLINSLKASGVVTDNGGMLTLTPRGADGQKTAKKEAQVAAKPQSEDKKLINIQNNDIININSAEADVFATLPGITKITAKSLVLYRESNGGFKSIDEFLDYSGLSGDAANRLRVKLVLSDNPLLTDKEKNMEKILKPESKAKNGRTGRKIDF